MAYRKKASLRIKKTRKPSKLLLIIKVLERIARKLLNRRVIFQAVRVQTKLVLMKLLESLQLENRAIIHSKMIRKLMIKNVKILLAHKSTS